MEKNKQSFIHELKKLFSVIILLSLAVFLIFFFSSSGQEEKIADLQRFASAEEFENYLNEAMEMAEYYYGFGAGARSEAASRVDWDTTGVPSPQAFSDSGAEAMPQRYSETNVQVEGVDEPDIVKTDGINIYASVEDYHYWIMPESGPIIIEGREVFEPWEASPEHLMPPRPRDERKIKIVKAFPAEEMILMSEIENSGKLLLKDNTLVVFGSEKIVGYNTEDRKNPKQKWEIGLEQRTQLAGARLYKDTIYLIISNRIQTHRPCVIEPLTINGSPLEVACTAIYRPKTIVPVDTTYTVLAVDLKDGEAKNKISFVGSANNSVIYVSSDNIYASYYREKPIYEFLADFFKEECRDIVPADVIRKLQRLKEYDISSGAKMVEFENIFMDWLYALDRDEELRIETELTNRLPEYYKKNMRDLGTTGIVKISMSDLMIKASGSVPGHLLNQFALDEHEGNLRVATTVGESFGLVTANDVYVLDGNLNRIGSVKDLGLEERIYSARFLGDMGYLVTFREIDPFYILDLSDPRNPQMKGELKIPGYSSYLHPIEENRILGIGKEGWNVKISLFDVSDHHDPREIDKYLLNESWSEILSNHHAFLLDSKHKIFFLPGSRGAYIFSFSEDKISLKKTIQERQVKRALYIDDYLYIVSARKITVLDQNDWRTIKELDF